MRRLNRLVAELLAFGGLWLLWDFRIAATFALLAIVVYAVQDELAERLERRRRPPDPPVLQDRLSAAPPAGGPGGRPGAGA